MAVKDANPSGVLVLIVNSSEALKRSTTIFLNLSSLLSPLLDPEPPPPVPAIVIRNLLSAQVFLRQFSSNAKNEFKFTRRPTLVYIYSTLLYPERFHYTFKGFRSSLRTFGNLGLAL